MSDFLYMCVCANDVKLQMYDLRYPPTNTNTNPIPNSTRKVMKHYRQTGATTKPYLVFQDYNPLNITPELDLSSELGILANGALFPHTHP